MGYRPAVWFGETATVRRRKRWSRTARCLEHAGLLARRVDLGRDRVRAVAITEAGWQWVLDNCGPGAVLSLDQM